MKNLNFAIATVLTLLIGCNGLPKNGKTITESDKESFKQNGYTGSYTISDNTYGTKTVVSIEGDKRIMVTNGLPNHTTGEFPNSGNPNKISAQNLTYTFPLNPVSTGKPRWAREPGVALNGIKFEPETAEAFVCETGERYRIEAFQQLVDLGLDTNHAHVQPTGAYHYHGAPTGLLKFLDNGKDIILIGFAHDGFPIYYSKSGVYKPSYKLALKSRTGDVCSYKTPKQSISKELNGTSPDGTFVSDWEYVKGLGTLDECNGTTLNGVALFDYRDGVNWSNALNTTQGGPGGGTGDGVWNRDAVVAERVGFDCAKGHPAGTNYHHHQNPSAFKLDLNVVSTVCNLYDADGLYKIDSAKHSPLIGFAYDGFPIYGAYGYKNADGTGGITRIKSGYQLRNITTRTVWADGTDVLDGPAVSTTYPLGYFREDYEWKANTGDASYLDIHNGRFCKTPEYPNGIYCYFATVDSKWNSTYPYVVGPTFYGVRNATKVANITETVSTYTTTPTKDLSLNNLNINIFPNPSAELIAVQMNDLVKDNYTLELYDITGKLLQTAKINKGSTIAYFNTQTLYAGTYVVKISNGAGHTTRKVVVQKD